MRAVVLGRGASGLAAAELLGREGAAVEILDGADSFPSAPPDLCVASPGVPLDHPWQRAARAAGVRVVSELQLGAERWRALGGRMLGVTGSKGKSSVVKLCADALGGVACGNYGTPLARVALARGAEAARGLWAVVEVSSFQLETTDLPPDAFAAAAILNLQEDHLDRHGTAAAYHALKRKLLAFARVAVDGSAPGGAPPAHALYAGCYFDNPVLAANADAAVALLRAAGLGDAEIAAAFARFEPLPHRFQTVCAADGVTWVDDSKATSLAALAAGVRMALARFGAKRVRLVAGGLPKGDNPNSVISLLQSGVEKVYLIGRCAEQFGSVWRSAVACEACGGLEQAVKAARRDAASGDCVLLSPGAASFDQFQNYSERGERFAALAKRKEAER